MTDKKKNKQAPVAVAATAQIAAVVKVIGANTEKGCTPEAAAGVVAEMFGLIAQRGQQIAAYQQELSALRSMAAALGKLTT